MGKGYKQTAHSKGNAMVLIHKKRWPVSLIITEMQLKLHRDVLLGLKIGCIKKVGNHLYC